MIEKTYQENDLLTSDSLKECIFNTDESGFNTNPNQRRMFFKKSAKDAYLITPTAGKAMYTVLVTGNAAGDFLPPLIVYKATHLHENWTLNGPAGAQYAVTDCG